MLVTIKVYVIPSVSTMLSASLVAHVFILFNLITTMNILMKFVMHI